MLREFARLYADEKRTIKDVERTYALWLAWGEGDLEEREISELKGLVPRIQDTVNRLAAPFIPIESTISGVEGPGDVSYYNAATIDRQILESWLEKGLKVKIHCYGSLMIGSDVDAELFNSVVESVECWGALQIPVEVYKDVSHKFKQIDTVHTYQ